MFDRYVIAVWAVELASWVLWTAVLNRGAIAPPGLAPVAEAVVHALCSGLGCLPYVYAVTMVYLYIGAVVVVNLFDSVVTRVAANAV